MSEKDNDIYEQNDNIIEACESDDNGKPSAPKNSFVKELIAQAEMIVIAFSIIILLFSFVARTCQVKGISMENTLYDKEFVVVSNLFYSPQKEDIIVFHQTGVKYNEPVVKRVIGVPGDTVKIEYISNNSMKVTVTDKHGNVTVLDEDYTNYSSSNRPSFYKDSTTYVEEGTVFVMGDNRNDSADSRDPYIGLVDQRRILGKVILRTLPLSRFGTVN